MSDLQKFLQALGSGLNDDERLIAGAFQGDPDDDIGSGWRPFGVFFDGTRWRVPGNPTYNRYVTVSAFRQNEEGEWRRKNAEFAAAVAFMIDDVGPAVGGGVKIPFSALCGLTPTALIETSPSNYQAWYMFKEPLRDEAVLRRLQDEYVSKFCNGKDTGMKGANRVGRLPESVNGKVRYNGWNVMMRAFNPDCRYQPQELAAVFGISCSPLLPRVRTCISPGEAKEHVANFNAILKLIRPSLKESKADRGGWIDMTCPWVDNHTKGIDNGAAIRVPDADNDWRGAFKCWHGSCEKKNFRSLELWVRQTLLDGADGDLRQAMMDYWIYDGMKEIVEALEEANKNG